MLELGFGRGQSDRQLPEHLGVSVERVARLPPGRVGKVRPGGGHTSTLPLEPIGRHERIRSCADNIIIEHFRTRDAFAERMTADVDCRKV